MRSLRTCVSAVSWYDVETLLLLLVLLCCMVGLFWSVYNLFCYILLYSNLHYSSLLSSPLLYSSPIYSCNTHISHMDAWSMRSCTHACNANKTYTLIHMHPHTNVRAYIPFDRQWVFLRRLWTLLASSCTDLSGRLGGSQERALSPSGSVLGGRVWVWVNQMYEWMKKDRRFVMKIGRAHVWTPVTS